MLEAARKTKQPLAAVILAGCQITGNFGFGGVRLAEGCNVEFRGATFLGRADFDEVIFSAGANFAGATFSSGANFLKATFSGVANFHGATFSGGVVSFLPTPFSSAGFYKATFSGGADFNDATFSGDANFFGATFSGDADFLEATFSAGDANFFGATFSGDANFHKATFSGGADFNDATFSGDANFYGATFSAGGVYFLKATFSGDANFHGATFVAGTRFRVTTANGISFRGADFRGVSEHEVHAAGNQCTIVDLTAARFALPATFDVVCDRQDKSDQGSVMVRLNRCFASKAVMLTGRHVRLDISGATFESRASFASARDDVGAGKEGRPGLVLHAADRCPLDNVVFESVDFSECLLARAYSLAAVEITGNSRFCVPPGPFSKYRRKRTTVEGRQPARRRVLYDEVAWRASAHVDRWWHKLEGPDRWSTANNLVRELPERPAGPTIIESTYRSLRHALESSSNAPGASDFYFGEMEMRLNGDTSRFFEKMMIAVYKVLSGYATKALWAFAWLLVFIVEASWVDHQRCGAGAGDTASGSLQSVLALPHAIGAAVSSPNTCTLNQLTFSLIGLMTVGIFALWVFALRSRVKR